MIRFVQCPTEKQTHAGFRVARRLVQALVGQKRLVSSVRGELQGLVARVFRDAAVYIGFAVIADGICKDVSDAGAAACCMHVSFDVGTSSVELGEGVGIHHVCGCAAGGRLWWAFRDGDVYPRD